MRRKDACMDEPTRDRIVKIVQANPQIKLRDLAEMVGIHNPSNVHYHIQRLEMKGLIHWEGTVHKRRGPEGAKRKRSRWERGDVKLPKHSAEEQQRLIEQVVKKAEGSGRAGEDFVGEDAFLVRGRLFRNDRARAHRIG